MKNVSLNTCVRTIITTAILFTGLAHASFARDCGDTPSYLPRVEGILLDAQGSPLTDATIVANRKGKDFEASTTADATGAFGFQRLPNGDYTLTARVDGKVVLETKVRLLPRAAANDHSLRVQLAPSSDRCPTVDVVPTRQNRE